MKARSFFALATIVLASLLACSTTQNFEKPGPAAGSEPITYAIYQLTDEGRALIAQGKLDYTVDAIDVVKWGSKDGVPTWKKSLKLANGYSIGALITRSEAVPGFGLWIKNDQNPKGFSWEWFDGEDGEIYKKLQGGGHVRVTKTQHPDGVEIQSVEFLTDITLRFKDDIKKGDKKETHVVVVTKGSVLQFAM